MKYINYIQENIHDGMKTMRIDIPKKCIHFCGAFSCTKINTKNILFAFIIITMCYFWFWIYHKNFTNVGISARKAAGITNREERELKNSCMWRTVSLFTSLSYNVKKFSRKKKL